MKYLAIAILTFFLTTCSVIKTQSLLNKGQVAQSDFAVEVPLSFYSGHIIVEPEVAGKKRRFIFDTGAPTLISSELAEEINLESMSSVKTTDSQSNKDDVKFGVIDSISLGGVDFIEIGTGVYSMNAVNYKRMCSDSVDVDSVKTDGLLGCNLMENCVWDLDFQKKTLTIANSIDKIDIPKDAMRVPFFKDGQGSPYIDLEIGDVKLSWITLDLGYAGEVSISDKSYRKLKKKLPVLKEKRTYSSSGYGIFGEGAIDTVRTILADSFRISELIDSNQLIQVVPNEFEAIGLYYVLKYRTIIDYPNKELIFIAYPKQFAAFKPRKSHGFNFNYLEEQLVVHNIYMDSKAQKAGLKIGDIILEVNGVDCRELTEAAYCDLIYENYPLKYGEDVDIVILREGEEMSLSFGSTTFFD